MKSILNYRGPGGSFTVAEHEHENALRNKTNAHGRALMEMLVGWAKYAEAHRKQCESGIGEDGVLGAEWEAIGLSLIGLLNGETGGLDCGSIDGNVRELLKAEGFTGEA